jgi:hypothetical protein
MQFTTGWIIASFLVGTVGLGIFTYGKKQTRSPQLIAGIVLMGLSAIVASPVWMVASAVLVVGALWAGTRAGY